MEDKTQIAMCNQVKRYSFEEIKTHNNEKSCWIVIHNKVYDVTKFLNEHPGGEEILLEYSGQDATENFEDIGHSTDAREIMAQYHIGDLVDEERVEEIKPKDWNLNDSKPTSSWKSWFYPISIAVLVSFFYRYFFLPNTSKLSEDTVASDQPS